MPWHYTLQKNRQGAIEKRPLLLIDKTKIKSSEHSFNRSSYSSSRMRVERSTRARPALSEFAEWDGCLRPARCFKPQGALEFFNYGLVG